MGHNDLHNMVAYLLKTEESEDTGEVQITAIIDGKVKLVFEASIRRHLKLEDSDGINTLPNTEIFKQLALIGTFNFSKMIFEGRVKNLDIPVESHHTPSGATTTSQQPLSSPSRIPTRQETKVPQPSSPTHTHVADEATSTCMDVRYGGAATTITRLVIGQGSGNIDKTSSIPHDSPLRRVSTLGSDEGSMTLNELTVKRLEKTVKSSQVRRRAKIVVSDDEELEDLSKQGRSMIEEIDQDIEVTLVTLQRRRRAISTASGGISTAKESVSTAGASMPVSTTGMVDKGRGLQGYMKKLVHLMLMNGKTFKLTIEADEELALRIQAGEREKYFEAEKARMLRLSFDELKNLFEVTMKRVQTFTPMKSDIDRTIPKIADESSKRDAKKELEQESSKKQKTGECSEPREKEDDEMTQ
nr:hypothetical protein [Tanacetum cinerariifolium]